MSIGLCSRLSGSENNDFVLELVMNIENYELCGVHNPQRKLAL
jgi:hypothetical protein